MYVVQSFVQVQHKARGHYCQHRSISQYIRSHRTMLKEECTSDTASKKLLSASRSVGVGAHGQRHLYCDRDTEMLFDVLQQQCCMWLCKVVVRTMPKTCPPSRLSATWISGESDPPHQPFDIVNDLPRFTMHITPHWRTTSYARP